MKLSNYFLIAGFLTLAVGAFLSVREMEPTADYVLIAGALLILIRGAIRSRERNEEQASDSAKD